MTESLQDYLTQLVQLWNNCRKNKIANEPIVDAKLYYVPILQICLVKIDQYGEVLTYDE